MVLVDTSVWIEHLRRGHPALAGLLTQSLVLTHPFIIGELACGSLKSREVILGGLHALPSAVSASQEEVLRLIDNGRLWGRGLGWVEVHLVASALLSGCPLWTLDKRLAQAARDSGLMLHRTV
jgi:hypothetical protein